MCLFGPALTEYFGRRKEEKKFWGGGGDEEDTVRKNVTNST
jgi:hypothetical protein